jgi:hypothetical protein
MLHRWSTEVVKKAPSTITNSLALHATNVRPADREKFSSLTLQFLSTDAQWYDMLSATKILLPGEELAIDTPIRANFPQHPPGHHQQVEHMNGTMFAGRQHIATEHTFADPPAVEPGEELVRAEETAVRALSTMSHRTQWNTPPLSDPFPPYNANQLNVNSSHWEMMPDFNAPTFVQNPQPMMAIDTTHYGTEPDCPRSVLYSQPAFTSLGLPVSNLINAFQLLPETVQQHFVDPDFIIHFKLWAINYTNRRQALPNDNNSHRRKRKRDWTDGEDQDSTDGEDDSGEEVPDSDDEE